MYSLRWRVISEMECFTCFIVVKPPENRMFYIYATSQKHSMFFEQKQIGFETYVLVKMSLIRMLAKKKATSVVNLVPQERVTEDPTEATEQTSKLPSQEDSGKMCQMLYFFCWFVNYKCFICIQCVPINPDLIQIV